MIVRLTLALEVKPKPPDRPRAHKSAAGESSPLDRLKLIGAAISIYRQMSDWLHS